MNDVRFDVLLLCDELSGVVDVGQMTSKIGNNFVQLDTSNAVEMAAGLAVPGLVAANGVCECDAVDEFDDGCIKRWVVFGTRTRARKQMIACCATVARMFIVRKNMYCVMIGDSERSHLVPRAVSLLVGVELELAFSMRAHVM